MTSSPPSTEGTASPTVTTPAPGRLERMARLAHDWVRAARRTSKRLEARAPRVIGFLRAVFYPCALALVGYMGYRAARETDLSQVHYWPLAFAVGAALVWWVALALGWAWLVDDGDPRVAVASWCKTQVARYMPGGIWQLVARATTVRGRVRDKLTAVTAENVIVLLVSLAIGGLWSVVHDWRWAALAVVAAAPLLASRWIARHTKITVRSVRRTSASYALGYVAYGVVGVLVQVAVSGLKDPTYPLYVAGAACIAWAVGLVVVFAPGGVGVRELVYIWMLSGLYPRAELEAAAVTTRLVTVLAELAVLAVVWHLGRRREGAEPATATATSTHEAPSELAEPSGSPT